MATNPSADGIGIYLFGCRREIFRLLCRLLFHCQKAACTFTEAQLILSTMIIPRIRFYTMTALATDMIGFGWSSGLQPDKR